MTGRGPRWSALPWFHCRCLRSCVLTSPRRLRRTSRAQSRTWTCESREPRDESAHSHTHTHTHCDHVGSHYRAGQEKRITPLTSSPRSSRVVLCTWDPKASLFCLGEGVQRAEQQPQHVLIWSPCILQQRERGHSACRSVELARSIMSDVCNVFGINTSCHNSGACHQHLFVGGLTLDNKYSWTQGTQTWLSHVDGRVLWDCLSATAADGEMELFNKHLIAPCGPKEDRTPHSFVFFSFFTQVFIPSLKWSQCSVWLRQRNASLKLVLSQLACHTQAERPRGTSSYLDGQCIYSWWLTQSEPEIERGKIEWHSQRAREKQTDNDSTIGQFVMRNWQISQTYFSVGLFHNEVGSPQQ